MAIKGIKFAPNATFEMAVADGFSHCAPGEGFDYIVGHMAGGEMKVVFAPNSPDFYSNVIDGVEGFGYTLVVEDKDVAGEVMPTSDNAETPEVKLHGQWFPADQVPANTDRRPGRVETQITPCTGRKAANDSIISLLNEIRESDPDSFIKIMEAAQKATDSK